MATLYDISSDLHALADLLAEVGGEITNEEAEAALDEWFGELGAKRDEKIDGYCSLIRELESRINARDIEIARMVKLVKSDRNAVDRLKGRLFEFFEAHHIQKMETERFRLSVRTNGGKVPVIIGVKPEDLPEELQQWSVSADNERIRALLESGEDLPFAALGERGRHLQIR